jgi:hypothetical protein
LTTTASRLHLSNLDIVLAALEKKSTVIFSKNKKLTQLGTRAKFQPLRFWATQLPQPPLVNDAYFHLQSLIFIFSSPLSSVHQHPSSPSLYSHL